MRRTKVVSVVAVLALLLSTVVVATSMAAPASAQTTTGTATPGTTSLPGNTGAGATSPRTGAGAAGNRGELPMASNTVRQAFDLLGAEVLNADGDDIGEIDNLLVVPSTGQIPYAIVAFGGFMGLGEDLTVIPMNAMRFDTERDAFILDVDEDVLEDAPTLSRYASPNTRELSRDPAFREFWTQFSGMNGSGTGMSGTPTTEAQSAGTGSTVTGTPETSMTPGAGSTPGGTPIGSSGSVTGTTGTTSQGTATPAGAMGAAGTVTPAGAMGAAGTVTPAGNMGATGTATSEAGQAEGATVRVGSMGESVTGQASEEDLVRLTQLGDFTLVTDETAGTGDRTTGTTTSTVTPGGTSTADATGVTGTATPGATGAFGTTTPEAAGAMGTVTPDATVGSATPGSSGVRGSATITGTGTTTGSADVMGTSTPSAGEDNEIDLTGDEKAIGQVEDVVIDVEAARVLYVIANIDRTLLGDFESTGMDTPGTGTSVTGATGVGTPGTGTTDTGATGTGMDTPGTSMTGIPDVAGTPSPEFGTGTPAVTGTGTPGALGTAAGNMTGTPAPAMGRPGATGTDTVTMGPGIEGPGQAGVATFHRVLIPWQAVEVSVLDEELRLNVSLDQLGQAPAMQERNFDFSTGDWDATFRSYWSTAFAGADAESTPPAVTEGGTAATGTGTPTAAGRRTARNIVTEGGIVMQAQQIIGTEVINTTGDDLGEIDGLLLVSNDGTVAYAVVAFGGFLGLGEQRVAVPWTALRFNEAETNFVLNISADELGQAPALQELDRETIGVPGWDAEVQDFWSERGEEVPDTSGTGTGTGTGGGTATPGATGAGATGSSTGTTTPGTTGAAGIGTTTPAATGTGATGTGATGSGTGTRTPDTMGPEGTGTAAPGGVNTAAAPGAGTNAGQTTDRATLLLANRLIGAGVTGPDGTLGEVDDLLIQVETGRVLHLIIGYGGFLGLGENNVPVPWSAVEVTTGDNNGVEVSLDADTARLEDAPQLDLSALPESLDRNWDAEVQGYWGSENQ